MRHSDSNRKLGRSRRQREALMRSQAKSLFKHQRIQTTEAKAKSLRPYVEKLITEAKKDSLHARRRVAEKLGSTDPSLSGLFSDIAKRYSDRSGGYTRIVKIASTGGKKEAFIELI